MNSLLMVGAWLGCITVAAGDTLRLTGIEPGDTVVVMWRGKTSTACNETFTVLRSSGKTELPNLVPSDRDCPSEIAVFSEKHAMVHEPANQLTHHPEDVHTVDLRPLVAVPVHIWTSNAADEQRARQHMETASQLFLKNKVGIKFEPAFRNAPNRVLNHITTEQCAATTMIQKSEFYTPKILNVYYVELQRTGRNCAIRDTPPSCQLADSFPKADGNITYIGTTATGTTLAHEFGHAFGLRPARCGGHPNPEETPTLAGQFDKQNIMWAAGGEERQHFTLGQVFRMNTQSDMWGGTMLIENGLRPGPGRECPLLAPDGECPALTVSWP